jgi:hypothetical protein
MRIKIIGSNPPNGYGGIMNMIGMTFEAKECDYEDNNYGFAVRIVNKEPNYEYNGAGLFDGEYEVIEERCPHDERGWQPK